ncbi:glycoside hydrolase family 74 protein [Apiospora rasikravindrae]|uniref:Glycoside hydrolase family 74 protein n=1 Tax=Apiospora rasikravindrae TaxID=990691 RepID=A0ABR1SEA2_9PEZI
MKNLFASIPALLLLASGATTAQAAAEKPAAPQQKWESVKLGGGGGFVPGIVFHPKTAGVAYARTDIGGLYRLNPSDDSWTAVTDAVTDNAGWHNWGIDALAVDPTDDQKVFAAFGLYTNDWDPTNGQIGRSADRGETWEFADLPFKVGGNMPGRGMGERLAVDPANPQILYFGARSGNGLWKSTDGGATFAKVDSFKAVGTYAPVPGDTTGLNSDIQGLTFVTFDTTSKKLDGGATSRIFVGTADNATASLYVTEDAGATWAALKDQPKKFFPHKGKLSPEEKALYISYADGSGPYDGTNGAVYRYDIATGAFKDITPSIGEDAINFGFGGLALDAKKPGTVVVASLNSWYPDQHIFRSTDSGATWSRLWEWAAYPEMNLRYKQNVDKAPWIGPGFLDNDTKHLGWMIECLEIDPHDSDHWLYGTGLTLYGGHDLTKWDANSWDEKLTISALADGIEETSVQDVASIPGGAELLAATGDVSGFTFASADTLGEAPKKNWHDPHWTTNVGIDFAGAAGKRVVRIGNSAGTRQLATSTDGGDSWTEHPGADTKAAGGVVAMSADGETIVWSASPGGVLRSAGGKEAFKTVASLPEGAVVASDKQNATVFYGASGAKFYVSTDAGRTFAVAAGKLGEAKTIRDVAAHPVRAGDVWVSTDAGVFHSTDYGASFAATSTALKNAQQVALGVGNVRDGWNVYAFGEGAAGARLYGSADGGKSWTDIQGDAQGFGNIATGKLAGSGNVAGLVYVGTNGRGVFRATVSLKGGEKAAARGPRRANRLARRA